MRTALFLVSVSIASLVSCSTPAAPEPNVSGAGSLAVVATLALDGHVARSVAVRDSVAAIGCGEGGLYLVDVSRPATPLVLAHIADLDATAVVFGSDVLLVAGGLGALHAATLRSVDALDPRAPVPGDAFVASFDPAAGLCAEGGLVAAARGRDGPLVTDERRLELAQTRSLVHDGVDDAVLLRRGKLFVHARRSSWFAEATHEVIIANADHGQAERALTLPGRPATHGALCLIGDDLLCARADAVDVVTAATTAAARVASPLAFADVTRIGVEGQRAVLLADGGARLVLIERAEAGRLEATAWLDLELPGIDVALTATHAFVADGEAGLVVVQIGRGDDR